MSNCKNEHIACTVDTCKYHCTDSNCCTRSGIDVGACNCKAQTSDATCCRSFEAKKGCC